MRPAYLRCSRPIMTASLGRPPASMHGAGRDRTKSEPMTSDARRDTATTTPSPAQPRGNLAQNVRAASRRAYPTVQFPSLAASLNRIEHQPSKLGVAGSSPAAVTTARWAKSDTSKVDSTNELAASARPCVPRSARSIMPDAPSSRGEHDGPDRKVPVPQVLFGPDRVAA